MNKLLLEIELVPASSWLNNVRAIVTEKQWDFIRKQVAARAWNVCEICGGVGPKHPVECHEIWHYDDQLLIQKLVDMIALCPNCHMVKHMGFAQIRGKGEAAFKHFIKVNKMKKSEANAYIKRAFKEWEDRSKKNWTLDISILSNYGIDIKQISLRSSADRTQVS